MNEVEPHHLIESFQDGYVVIFVDALGRRWQDHTGTLTRAEADALVASKKAA